MQKFDAFKESKAGEVDLKSLLVDWQCGVSSLVLVDSVVPDELTGVQENFDGFWIETIR
jgi:hypothetical protein